MTYAELKRVFFIKSARIEPAWWGRVMFGAKFNDKLRGDVWAAVIEGWPEDCSKAKAVRNTKAVLRNRYEINPITLLLIGAIIQIAVNVIWEWLKQRWDERHAQLRAWQRMMLGDTQP